MLWARSVFVVAILVPGSALSPATSASPSSPDGVTAFVNVAVVPMDRPQVLPEQTVLVHGDTILRLGPSSQIAVPAGAARIDGRGKFLLPGLGDMHMHLFRRLLAEDWDEHRVQAQLFCYLAHGVTTVRHVETYPNDTFVLALRTRLRAGELLGPRLYLTTKLRLIGQGSAELASSDFLDLGSNTFEPGMVDTAVARARAAGLRVAGGVPRTLGLERALQLPYAAIDRLEGYGEVLAAQARSGDGGNRNAEDGALLSTETLRRQWSVLDWDSLFQAGAVSVPRGDDPRIAALAGATRQAGVWNIPLLHVTERMLTLWAGATPQAAPVLQLHQAFVRALRRAGAGLLLGSDAPTWGVAHGSGVTQELVRLVAAGLTPYEALAAGTRNVAAFLGTLGETGTIEIGKRADLVLLDGNPMVDVGVTAAPAGVMIRGQWLPKSQLRARLDTQACAGG